MPGTKLVVGTRGSALALWQANFVVERLSALEPDLEVKVTRIKTQGDLVRNRALSQKEEKRLFVKEIESALLAGKIDLAVHSLKDVPTEQPEGLTLAAILERADPRDALVARGGNSSLASLPPGAIVGTSSLRRRRAQVLAVRPDLQVRDLRGNVDTRLSKLYAGQYDAMVLAAAGLIRLGRQNDIGQILPVDLVLPAVGQGALRVESRANDKVTRALLARLDHPATRQATQAERAFLNRLKGSCQVPIGAGAEVQGHRLHLRGLVASVDGAHLVRDEACGPSGDATRPGRNLAERMLNAGGRAILEEIRQSHTASISRVRRREQEYERIG